MRLGELLQEDQVFTDFRARDRWEAIRKLVDALAAIPAARKAAVTDALVAREKLASTGMEHGVAIPHASVDGIDEAVAAIALSPEGIPFQSADGKPAHLIILLVIPRKSIQQHIRTLAWIARLLNQAPMRESLLAAKTGAEALQIICAGEKQESA